MAEFSVSIPSGVSGQDVKFTLSLDKLLTLIKKLSWVSKSKKEKMASQVRRELLKEIPDENLVDQLLEKLKGLGYDTKPIERQKEKVTRYAAERSKKMARTGGRVRKVGRSAITGRFMSVRQAQRRKNTSIVQTIKVPKKR
jgi:hypothetical protein